MSSAKQPPKTRKQKKKPRRSTEPKRRYFGVHGDRGPEPRPKAPGGSMLGKLMNMFAASIVIAVTTTDDDVRAAGGDFIEAMVGHRCGPKCWHAQGETDAEREAWWAERLREYDDKKAARAMKNLADVMPPATAAPAEPQRCAAKTKTCFPPAPPTFVRCCLPEHHAGPHCDKPGRPIPPGAVAWWTD